MQNENIRMLDENIRMLDASSSHIVLEEERYGENHNAALVAFQGKASLSSEKRERSRRLIGNKINGNVFQRSTVKDKSPQVLQL